MILPFIDDLTGSRDIAAIVATGFSVVRKTKKNLMENCVSKGVTSRLEIGIV